MHYYYPQQEKPTQKAFLGAHTWKLKHLRASYPESNEALLVASAGACLFVDSKETWLTPAISALFFHRLPADEEPK